MATTSAQVQQLYVGLLGRAADKAGLDYWLNQLNASPATLTLENLRSNIVSSQAEYKATFGSLSRADTVTKIYNNLFGRAPDAAGQAYWSTGAGATVNVDQLTLAFINGASATDTQALTNKTVVAEVYTSTAGSAFVAADAAKIIANVTATASTVGTALGQLTDGSLSGIAIPAAVAQLKAVETATAAVTAYQTAKVTELQTLNTNLVAAAKAIKADDASVTVVATTSTDTAAVKFAALTNATTGIATEINDARILIGDGKGGATVTTTAQLQVNADAAAKTLADTTAALKLAGNGYITVINNYQAAVTAAAGVKDVSANVLGAAKATVSSNTAFSTDAQKTALVAALKDTGVTALSSLSFATANDAATSVDAVYTALIGSPAVIGTGTAANPQFPAVAPATAQVAAKIEAALTSYGYANLKAAAATHVDFTTKTAAVTSAETALKAAGTADTEESAYIAAVAPAATATKAVADSKVIDALEVTYKAAVDGNTAVVGTQTTAQATVTAATNLHEITAGLTVDADTFTAASDVFYFGNTGTVGLNAAKDATITNAGALGSAGVDSIYVGTDFVKGTGTVNAAGAITGGNDAAKEVFFFQKGNDTYVVVETKAFGSSTVVNYADVATPANTPDAAVIKLTGVGIEKVSFANGVVSVA
ncbi:DUF4214 domain-containing protein [Pseudomonas caspiana]